MSKKLPKDNLKKVSGAAGSKGVVTNEALQGKKVAGGKQVLPGQNVLPGQVAGGRNVSDKGVSKGNFVENE